jgi:radical SAM superfamily enzyme YgiQ (UPF0313 family)
MRQPPYYHPVGLAYVAGALRGAGHEVQVLDLNVVRQKVDTVKYILPKIDYDVVGLSGLITTFKYNKELVPYLREAYPKARIVIGGGGFTSDPKTYMREIKPDYGVAGEGEFASVRLLNDLDVIPTGSYIKTNRITNNLDTLPDPAYDLLPMTDYLNVVKYGDGKGREAGMFATRGCPMDCNFCYHVFGKGVRYRSVDAVLDEIEMFKYGYGVTSLLFGDECITARGSFMTEMCRGMIDRKLDMEWVCYSRVDTIREDMLKLMAEAGCFQIGFGMESGSPKILKVMNKKTTVEEMEAAYKLAGKYIKHVATTFIFGYPGEDDTTIRETKDFIHRNKMHPVVFFLQPYPGTAVFEDNRDKITNRFGKLGNYYSHLDDAGTPIINLTDWTDEVVMDKFATALKEYRE